MINALEAVGRHSQANPKSLSKQSDSLAEIEVEPFDLCAPIRNSNLHVEVWWHCQREDRVGGNGCFVMKVVRLLMEGYHSLCQANSSTFPMG
jgi:hypothetical protein